MARQPAGSPVLRALQEQYVYDGIETCAADGTCMLHCPVGIGTGMAAERDLFTMRVDGTDKKRHLREYGFVTNTQEASDEWVRRQRHDHERPVHPDRAIERCELGIDARMRHRQKKIVEHAEPGRERNQECGSDQHRRDRGRISYARIKNGREPKQQRKRRETPIGDTVDIEMAQRRPETVGCRHRHDNASHDGGQACALPHGSNK